MSAITMSQLIIAGPNHFDYDTAREWTRDRRQWSIAIVAIYLITVFGLKKAMKNRPAYDLQMPLVVWNACLTVFSAVGLYYVGREFAHTADRQGFQGLYCRTNQLFTDKYSGYWTWMFTLSKVVELGDSFFLVLRKRPLSFLQYYHHSLTLVYCWWSYLDAPSFNRIGINFNYLVHTVMYAYFLCRSLRIRLPPIIPQCITALQILQFITGTTLLLYGHYQVTVNGAACDWPLSLAHLAIIMNLSYLYLFAQFFYNSYVKGQHSSIQNSAKKRQHAD